MSVFVFFFICVLVIAALIGIAYLCGCYTGEKSERRYWQAHQREMIYRMMAVDDAEMNSKERILQEMARCSLNKSTAETPPVTPYASITAQRTRRRTKEPSEPD